MFASSPADNGNTSKVEIYAARHLVGLHSAQQTTSLPNPFSDSNLH
jgi:hypothetical protein